MSQLHSALIFFLVYAKMLFCSNLKCIFKWTDSEKYFLYVRISIVCLHFKKSLTLTPPACLCLFFHSRESFRYTKDGNKFATGCLTDTSSLYITWEGCRYGLMRFPLQFHETPLPMIKNLPKNLFVEWIALIYYKNKDSVW